jgi:Zn finger protein HypA/HybF involved in hydrogenase expression
LIIWSGFIIVFENSGGMLGACKEMKMGKEIEDFTVQKFEHRCPYCDQIIAYERFELKAGDNPIQCPSCQKTFIKIVSEPAMEGEAG